MRHDRSEYEIWVRDSNGTENQLTDNSAEVVP
jgi:hypothetical protein